MPNSNLLKKTVTYAFLLLFLYSAIGYFPVFLLCQHFVRNQIKHQIKNSIHEKELLVFSFRKEEFARLKWEKKNKEFHYGNSLYDVVRKTIDKGGNILVYCINDFREKQIFATLEREVSRNSESSPTEKSMQNIFKLLSNSFLPGCLSKVFISVFQSQKIISYSHSFFPAFIVKVPSPPPKFI